MSFRKLDIGLFPKLVSNIMAAPSSSDSASHVAALDLFRALGGNAIHLHGEGGETHSRQAVGAWLHQHGIRDEFFLCSQICHDDWDDVEQKAIDRFTAESVEADIAMDLDLLGTEYLDIVYLDDSPEANMAPVLEALGRQIESGRIRAFGVRNWTPERIRAANVLTSTYGRPSISAIVTTELSLLTPTEPLWPGYVPFDAEMRAVAEEFGLVVFAHFDDFTQGQCLLSDEDELSRLRPEWIARWDTPSNREIVARLQTLAADRGLTPREVNVACAFNQPFPVIGIVGLASGLQRRGIEYERASTIVIPGAQRAGLTAHTRTSENPL